MLLVDIRACKKHACLLALCGLLVGCDTGALNNPYPKQQANENILYTSFSERPKTLDPAKAYSENEYVIIGQIYEPPLQYHYLKRPYQLIPLTAAEMPTVAYFSHEDLPLSEPVNLDDIAYTVYTLRIQPGIYFQPHPSLAKNSQGENLYLNLPEHYLKKHRINQLNDFEETGTRELTAEDYVYQIKRMADPSVQSPLFGFMSDYIVGLADFHQKIADLREETSDFVNLHEVPLAGVKVIDKYTYQIKLNTYYPQFMYWLAMPFFAPMPWEADKFSRQPGMQENNITLDWFPVGTGAYRLTENNPNRKMVLARNPYFHEAYYPRTGELDDSANGLLVDAGKRLPFIDQVVFSLEKEAIPRWNKFLQGYYDSSSISADSFDQAVQVSDQGELQLTAAMREKGITLYSAVDPSIYFFGFNMLDEVVGGDTDRARKLRQAISIAVDMNEFIAIFLNGRGIEATGPIPPGIFGFQEGEHGSNPYVFDWVEGKPKRKSLAEAKGLLAQAGYPNGRDATTGQPLVLMFDLVGGGGSDDKARVDWLTKQLAKLGIQLNVLVTQYNRFQDRVRHGDVQMFMMGWNADYPDPENFLFLLYGPNGKVHFGGENAVNYQNADYDRLFEQMQSMPDGPERLEVIEKMVGMVQRDAPWIWGLHPKRFTLSQSWNRISKPSAFGHNTLQYSRIDPQLRAEKRQAWNQPVWWPLWLIGGVLLLVCVPVVWHYWQREHAVRGQ